MGRPNQASPPEVISPEGPGRLYSFAASIPLVSFAPEAGPRESCCANTGVKTMRKPLEVSVIVFALFLSSVASFAQVARPAVYVEPQNGFETYLAAAISKKNVPVDVVTDQTKATYTLKAAPVEIKSESTGEKVTRCLFASCAGIEDKGSVSVQLIEASSSKMVWAYAVNKQRIGAKDEQAMAEAVAKHLKEFVEHK